MLIHDLVDKYTTERNYSPNSINDILDYYQHKYISGEIDLKSYKQIFAYLHRKGATSAHEIEENYKKEYIY